MEKDLVIQANGIGKRYQIGEINTSSLLKKITSKSGAEEYWALKDVSFDVKRGEVLGIIGKNGAGKSTLLKILSQITKPTKGTIRISGKVASLLEVGTGFHPDLSGRDNIFMNGAILGMKKSEIKNKFNEIVNFSGVEKYIDTPVKRYSSGMYVRLAFAVAAHLEPEILIVDEVLAVGDAEFQKKCLGKMKDVAGQGRTVLFVSHNMAAIQNLSSSCMYLGNGQIQYIGETQDTISKYLDEIHELTQIDLKDRQDRKGNGFIRIVDVVCKNRQGEVVKSFSSGQDAFLYFKYSSKEKKSGQILIALGFNDNNGVRIFHANNEQSGIPISIVNSEGYFVCEIPKLPLVKGIYTATIFVSINGEISDWIQDAFVLNVEDGDFFGTGKIQFKGQGNFLVRNSWNISY